MCAADRDLLERSALVRILLVQPPPPPDYVGFRRTAVPEPLALESIGAVVCRDHDVKLLDLRLWGDFDDTMQSFQPDVVAVTCLTTEVYAAQDLLVRAKELDPSVFALVGGLHASLMPHDFEQSYVDAIAVGEGETVLGALVEHLDRARAADRAPDLSDVPGVVWQTPDGTWKENESQPLIASLDDLPMPARHLAEEYADEYFFLFDKPHGCIASSRGCPFRCTFCSIWKFYRKKCRYKSAERVADELEVIEPTAVSFVDDNFLAHVPRAWKILELIKERGIKKAFGMQARVDTISKHPDLIEAWKDVGLETIVIGFESYCQEKLDEVSKGATIEQNERAMDILTDLGVHMWGAFIVDPDFTREDFQRLKEYREDRGIIYPQFTVMTPLPGTDYYEEMQDKLIIHDYRLYDALHAVVPTRLPREEFYKEFASLYRPDNVALIYDWISEGRITVERARHAARILHELGDYRNFLRGEESLDLTASTS